QLMENYREYTGNLHVHSLYSDGSGRHTDIAEAAADAGLDFVIVTDHNLRVEGLEGYYGRVLLLIGQEAHNSRRRPQANHLLIYGANQELAPYTFGSAQTLIQKANECGGICYIAHPVERSSPLGEDFHAIPWIDWPIEGITGLEIWNYMSEFKGLLWSRLAALIYAFLPDWGIRGPYRATLRLWDELLSKGTHLAALGGADAHASRHTMAGITRTIFPYEYLFRCVNTHVLTDGPLTGDETRDRRLIYDALRTGRTWVGYDLPHPTHGFQFFARSGAARRTMGEELKRLGAVTLEVNTPARGEIRLLRDGQLIGKTTGSTLSYTSAEAGIYRVEVYRKFRGMRVGWIFSSPIYIR
ncbi:MAG: CehA/McbA family metallohydrolase, partial [Anaerolineae bacterium]|nr:CehA/McbA family metallohydrolase [Anaerolineae bacterium]